uniref:HMA domain-containing protein n=1 Tax=Bionectria ochroleuca TaxID=29856 RepID=A0A0B7KMP0_BIOOC
MPIPSKAVADAANPATTTTFLIPSIHCSTCASFIETLIRQITPNISVETSIISHTVSIRHNGSADIKKMVRALGDAGYEVDTVATGPEAQAKLRYSFKAAPADDDFALGRLFTSVPKPWNFVGRARQERARSQHVNHCDECRSKLVSSPPTTTHDGKEVSEEKGGGPFVVVESSSALPDLHQATLTIDGMTCSSCVGNVTESLLSQSWVEAVDVGLLTRSAIVRFHGGPDKAQTVADLIEDAGYEATVEQVERVLSEPQPTSRDTSSNTWRAELSVGGMSCSSCVGSITQAVEELTWVETVHVNLLTSSATIVFQDRSHLDELVSIIIDAGYTAKLSDLVNLNDATTSQGQARTVQIRINGMYCEHCPERVLAALENHASHVDIDEAPSLQNPILTVSYIPNVPTLTIRTILATIANTDETLKPIIYHPPTIEERAQQMQARSRRRLLYRLLLAVAAAIPGLIIGIVFMTLVSKDDPNRMYLMERINGVSRGELALLIASTPVYFFSADIFHRRAIKEIYAMWKPGSHVPLLRRFYRFGSMDMLVSFATTIAYFASVAELIITATNQDSHHHMPERMPYFDSVIFLTMFLLAGRMIEAYSKAKTGEAVTQLGNLRPKDALLIAPSGQDQGDTQLSTVPVDTLESGDSVVVVHGGSPPWDGILLDSTADFAESSLTGESKPVHKSMGDEIYSGTINKGAPITMRIHGAAGKSLLDNIIHVVREGQSKRAPIERVADTVTGYFVPFVTLVAIVVWLTWLGLGVSGRLPEDYKDTLVGGWPFWSLQFAIAVFVIAHGILAKGGGEAFQEASGIDVIVFDKTGTLTEGGDLKLVDHVVLEESAQRWGEDALLAYVGEVERNSSHPLGKALVDFCEEKGVKGSPPQQVDEMPGKGMKATFFDKESTTKVEILVGNETLMADHGVSFSQATIDTLDGWKEQAKSVVLMAARDVSNDGGWVPAAIFSASDPIRPESKSVVDALRARGVDVWMISGDNAKTALAVGAMVAIEPDHIIAGVLPEQKADKIKYLQGSQPKMQGGFLASLSGRTRSRAVVAMVGDGVNDSPALTAADVGIAIGAGSDVAISAAEFVLIKSDLNSLLTLVQLSRAVFRRVMFNFAWAGIYNLVALPIAAGVIYPVRSNGSYTRLDPVWASLAMALSSLSVICSSLLLRTTLPLVGFRNTVVSGSASKN